MKHTLTLLSLGIALTIMAQNKKTDIAKTQLVEHLSVLAHDSLEGRETGTIGLEKAARYLVSHYKKIGLKPFAANGSYRQWYKLPYAEDGMTTDKASNIIGMIEGESKPEEFVVISAHYDHIGKTATDVYNGADDDGSGTAALLAIASHLMEEKKQGRGLSRSVVFIAFSGEEKGLWGSEFFSDHPTFSLKKTTADINIDMIGRIDTERNKADTMNYVYVVGHNKLSSDLHPLLDETNAMGHQLVLDYKFDSPFDFERIYYRSDHYNFARKGVPVLFFYDGMLLGDYHQLTDEIEKITWDLYKKRVDFITDLLKTFANRSTMLKRDIPLND